MILIALIASILALGYGIVLYRSVLAAPTSTERANEIARAIERADEVIPTATAAIDMAYRSNAGVGMLLGQRLLGAKAF